MDETLYIGIDLGGTKVAAALLTAGGDLLHRDALTLEGKAGPAVGDLLRRLIDQMTARAAGRDRPVGGIGIGVPGIYYRDTGRVWAPNIPGWDDFPLLAALEDAPARVVIDSDRACYILGEVWRGAAAGCRHAVFLAVGTGIGAGILIDGRVLRGAHDIAGAIGWLALDKGLLPPGAGSGQFESHASGAGLVNLTRRLLETEPAPDSSLRRLPPANLRTADVFAAFDAGDPLARRVLDLAVGYWGRAVANVVSLFNPEKVIFGGGVFGPARSLLPAIRAEAERWGQPVSMRRVSLEASLLGSDAGLYGAARLAVDG